MYIVLNTKIGLVKISGDQRYIKSLEFLKEDYPQGNGLEFDHFKEAKRQIEKYFLGSLREFDLPLKAEGTDFQKSVWNEMTNIPYGEVKSYGEVAKALGKPKASQALGSACGKNPLPILIPCHRIVAKEGLGGFTGGLDIKLKLLEVEGVSY